MTATRISDLASLGALDPSDLFVVVDVSDTSMAASGTNKKVLVSNAITGGTGGPYNQDSATAWTDAFGAPSAYDCEFDRTTNPTGLPTNWVFQNQNSATYLEQLGKGIVSIPSGFNSNNDITAVVQPVSAAGSYTAVGKAPVNTYKGPLQGVSVGLILTDGTKGVAVWNTDPVVVVSRWTAIAGTYTDNPGTLAPDPINFGTLIPYWRIKKNSSSSYDFAFSYDGTVWNTVLTGYDVSAFMTPTHFGFMVRQPSGVVEVTLDWFRVR